MNEKNIMSKEAFNELIDGLEYVESLTEYGRKNIKYHVQKLQQENQQLKDELKSKPDAQITLQDDKGNKFMIIQTERIDMQVELNKTIEKLFNNWNKLKEYFNERIEVCDNRLSSPFCNFEKATKERLIFSQCLEKLEELEGSDNNE